MKKIISFVFVTIVMFFAITSFGQKKALSASEMLNANLEALSAGVACACTADCPMGSECVENVCTGLDDSGRAICYSQIAIISGSKCLACGTCEWEEGIGSQKGGYCKW